MTETETFSVQYPKNRNFRLKYKHSNKEEIKKQIKAERAKARKDEITSSSFNERLGLEVRVTKIGLSTNRSLIEPFLASFVSS